MHVTFTLLFVELQREDELPMLVCFAFIYTHTYTQKEFMKVSVVLLSFWFVRSDIIKVGLVSHGGCKKAIVKLKIYNG